VLLRSDGELPQRRSYSDNKVTSRVHGLPFGETSIREAVRMTAEVFHNLKKVLKGRGYNTASAMRAVSLPT
jgi:hypothetical protein